MGKPRSIMLRAGHWVLIVGTVVLWLMVIQIVRGCQSMVIAEPRRAAGADIGAGMLAFFTLAVGGFLALIGIAVALQSEIRLARERGWARPVAHASRGLLVVGSVGGWFVLEALVSGLIELAAIERRFQPASHVANDLLGLLFLLTVSSLSIVVVAATLRSYAGLNEQP